MCATVLTMNPIILADAVLVSSGSGTGSNLVRSLILIVVVALIFGLFWWLLDYLQLPEPFGKIARAVIAIVAVIFLAYFLLGLVGIRI